MNRYFSSFVITTLIYVGLVASLVVFSPKIENISDKTIDEPNMIKVSMMAKPKVVQKTEEPKPKVQPKPKPKPEPKPEPKKIIKKEVAKKIPKKEEIVKKEIVKEEITKEEVVEEPLEEEPPKQKPSEPIATQQTQAKKQVITKEETKVDYDQIKAKQNIFFTKIRNEINQNKSYPRVARRRGIEGEVQVSFDLLSDGSVKNIEFLSGKRIFKKSITKAIKKSFPMEVDNSLFSFPKKFKITVKYILN